MRRITAPLALFLALTLGVAAQEPARPAPSESPATDGQQATPAEATDPAQPVFRAGINFVRVDVIATDRQGNPVMDLTADDFEVSEDGQAQTAETFRFVRASTRRRPNARRGPSAPARTRRTPPPTRARASSCSSSTITTFASAAAWR